MRLTGQLGTRTIRFPQREEAVCSEGFRAGQHRSRGGTKALTMAIGLLIAVAARGQIAPDEAAQQAGGEPPDPAPGAQLVDCESCAGSGGFDCEICEDGRIEVPCKECGGAKRLPCDRCERGGITCKTCAGTTMETYIVGGGLDGRRRQMTRPCRICEGRGAKQCWKCRGNWARERRCPTCRGGAKTFTEKCVNCESAGFFVCENCGGSGKREIVVRELAPAGPSLAIRSKLHRAIRELNAVLKFREKLHKRSAGGEEELDESIKELEKLRERAGTGDLERRSSAFSERLRELRTLRDECKARLRSIKGGQARAALHEDRTRGLLTELSSVRDRLERDPLTEVPEVRLDEAFDKAGALHKALETVRQRILEFESEFVRFKRNEDSLSTAVERALQKLHDEEKILAATVPVEESFAANAKRFRLPAATFEPDLRESTPEALSVRIGYMDREAGAADVPALVSPSEEFIQHLPAILTDMFAASPRLRKVGTSISGERLGRTGLTETWRIQTFAVLRDEWEEIQRGAHRGDWEKELAAIGFADPPYPRTTGGYPVDLVFYSLIGSLFFALGVFFVARTRMMN